MTQVNKMKALICQGYGGADVLDIVEVPVPKPLENEVLIRVMYTTVNRTDTGILSGSPWFARLVFGLRRPKRMIRGTEYAGRVVGIGTKVSGFAIGDEVFGFHDEGTSCHAEFVCIATSGAIARVPKERGLKEVVACSEGPFYAWNYINRSMVGRGANVLINGVSGGIGTAAAQLSHAIGANVYGTCLSHAMGVQDTVDVVELWDGKQNNDVAFDKRRYDLILDTVGDWRYGKFKGRLTATGVFASTELGPYGANVFCACIPSTLGGKAMFPLPAKLRECQDKTKQLIEQNKYRAVVDRVLPFSEIKDAYAYVAQGNKLGNVIVSM